MQNNKLIPIVFITDDNYAMPTTVAITSLKINRDPGVRYKIFVLTVDLTEEHKARMLSLGEDGFEVSVMERELTEQMLRMKTVRGRVTPAAMLKFELPGIFADYDKLLYLDSDILVERDLSELYDTDVSEVYAGVVKDVMTFRGVEGHLAWLQFKEEAYFNSGMLLLNLEKIRRDDISAKLVDYRRYGLNRFTDQDTLNVVFGGKVKYLSARYNLLNCFFEWETRETLSDFYGIEFPERLEDTFLQAAVLHLGDKQKPWKYDVGFLSELYRSYYDRSPYRDVPLVLEEWREQVTNSSVQAEAEAAEEEDDQPRITVVMPSLNVEPYIRVCIESALSQSLTNIEILCVDAGSTDGTLEILREYEEKDERVRVILSDKKSYGYQVNVGIRNARGKYLAILETDDYILPDMYEELYQISEWYQLDLIKADFFRFTESDVEGKDNRIYANIIRSDTVPYNRVLDSSENMDVFQTGNIPWAGLYNLEFLRQNDIWLNESPGASYQDNGLWFQVMCQAHRVYFYNKPFYCLRRDNPNSSFYARDKVFAICGEYDFIRNVLNKSPTLVKRFAPQCALLRFRNCQWTLDRIAEQYKLEFYQRFSADFRAIRERGELDEKLFAQGEWKRLNEIMEDPVEFYYANNSLNYEFFRLLPPERYEQAMKRWYMEKKNEELDLESPTLFDEKIQWLKLYHVTPEKKKLSDQYYVREWVKEKGCGKYLIPLLGVWDSVEEIGFDELPDSFVLRVNAGRDLRKVVEDKAAEDMEELREELESWMTGNYALCGDMELAYSDIRPKVFAEPLLCGPGRERLTYNFYCFGGEPRCVWVDVDGGRFRSYSRCFDGDWNMLSDPETGVRRQAIREPENLSEMRELARTLSAGFPFVCISLYSYEGSVYFEELTFTPQSGLVKWPSLYLNKYFGDQIHLPYEQKTLPEQSFAEGGYGPLPDPPFSPERDVWKVLEIESGEKENQMMRNFSLNRKLQQTYKEKSELNARLQQTYKEKSELNARLQQAYKEKSERGVTIKEERTKVRGLEKEKAELQQELDAIRGSFTYRAGRAITWLPRKLRQLLRA